MNPDQRAAATRRAIDALALVRVCEQRGVELEMAGTTYVATFRKGTSVHVIAGEPGEVLSRLPSP